MKILKARTKIEAVLACAFLIVISIASVFAVTRTISDTRDTVDTYIRNSNGNYWAATGDNIQVAIDNLGIVAPVNSGYGSPRATVWLPGNTTLTISSTVIIKDDITLDMQGCQVKPNANINCFLLHRGARIRNGAINVSGVGSYSSNAILFLATDMAYVSQLNYIDNIQFVSASQRGTAIYLNTSGAADQQISMAFVNRIQISGFKYGIFINHNATSGDNYINGNTFTNIYMNNVKYCIKLYQAKAEVTENTFENIVCNCSSATEYIVWDGGNGTQYDNIVAKNWDNNSGTRKSYTFVTGNFMYLCFRGGSNDLSLPTWNANNNAYTILNLDNSTLSIGRVTQYYP